MAETILWPLDEFKDEELPLYVVFDTMTMEQRVALNVGKVFLWMLKHKGSKAEQTMKTIIKANLGEKRYKKIKELYWDSYESNGNKMKRYFYFKEPEEIYDIMDSFSIIDDISSVLAEVATEYLRKETQITI